MLELIEPPEDFRIHRVITGLLAGFGVATMHAECRTHLIRRRDDVLKSRLILRHVVGHAAHHEKLEGRFVIRRKLGGQAGSEKAEKQDGTVHEARQNEGA
jgi:hypothetical protein